MAGESGDITSRVVRVKFYDSVNHGNAAILTQDLLNGVCVLFHNKSSLVLVCYMLIKLYI